MRVVLRLILMVAVPVVLTMTAVRLTTLPWYPAWEYGKANFPPDPLEMQPADRLQLARLCIHYLNLPRGSGLLDDLRLPDGERAFNARELQHMDDVKGVYDRLTALAALLLAAGALAGWALSRWWGRASLWGALSDGGLLTLILLVLAGAWMALGFEVFFTAFHGVFFTGDSWLFAHTDTLIRLFPLQFWADAGMLIAGVVGVIALGLALLGRALQKRAERPLAPLPPASSVDRTAGE